MTYAQGDWVDTINGVGLITTLSERWSIIYYPGRTLVRVPLIHVYDIVNIEDYPELAL